MASDEMKLAGTVLENAFKAVMTERGQQHGATNDSFEMVAQFWTIYLRHKHMHKFGIVLDLNLNPADIGQMMSLMKKSRAMYGDPSNEDNYVDDVGYTALSRMLNEPKPEGELDFTSALRGLTQEQRDAYNERLALLDKREEELRTALGAAQKLITELGIHPLRKNNPDLNPADKPLEVDREAFLKDMPSEERLPPADGVGDIMTRLQALSNNLKKDVTIETTV